MKKSSVHPYIAECLGTFLLTFAVLSSLLFTLPLATPIIAGLTLGILVYTLGPISGAHVNPAVTIGLLSIGKIKGFEAVKYILAQCVGAVLALELGLLLGGQIPPITVGSSLAIGISEAIGAFVLVMGVSSVVHGKVHEDASGLTIGSSLLLGVLLAMGTSNGVLNPAVSIGIGSVSIAYILGPIAGGIAAAWSYRALLGK